MKLPTYKTKQRPAHDQKQLAAWLAERELDLLLRDDEQGAADVPAAKNLRYNLKLKPAEAVREGDVVLLRPAAGADWSPVYVLILDGPSSESWLGIPFSRYATPAVPGEWQTNFTATPLRVLCFWNVNTVTRSNFIPGAVKHCTPAELAEIKKIHERIARGDEVDARERQCFGPPLLHPADPRYEYLDEERERLDDHLRSREPSDDVDNGSDVIPFRYPVRERSELLLAAEEKGKYGEEEEEESDK